MDIEADKTSISTRRNRTIKIDAEKMELMFRGNTFEKLLSL